MINEGIKLLEPRFATTLWISTHQQKQTTTLADDVSPIEMFYASTSGASTTKSKMVEESVPFLIDRSKEYCKDRKEQEERENLDKKDKADAARREHYKQWIDRTLIEEETRPLARYLHRCIREKATLDKMTIEEETRKVSSGDPHYVSYSFLIDGIYPVIDGIHKEEKVDSLRKAHFKRIDDNSERVRWTAGDENKTIIGTVFGPVLASARYEDNLQRLFLRPPFDVKETQRLNPRGILLAYMAMFAPDHDPIVDIAGSTPTTLRGLFSNVLDGTLYRGTTMGSLKYPYEVSNLYEGQDIKCFCDRLLKCSYYSVFLTYLGVKAWRADRYPKDRFVIDTQGCVSIKLKYKEVIYQADDFWIFKSNHFKTICYTNNFSVLITLL